MSIYKSVQKEIFTGYVFPIGEEPNNKSWSGFQSVNENSKSTGYVTIFRELENTQAVNKLSLRLIQKGQKVKLTNLQTGDKSTQFAGPNGLLEFNINNPADFLFLKWEIISK